ncbi:MAG: lamin tail domain-containing protein [Bacteroidales bacterium]|nr:lamin tail domain-containing protein [Bacteroidales bacterium]
MIDTALTGAYQAVASFVNNDITEGSYAGLMYKYTKTQDQILWLDNFSLTGNFQRDTLPPKIIDFKVVNPFIIRLSFSEPNDTNTCPHLTVNGITPLKYSYTAPNAIEIDLAHRLENGTTQQLIIDNYADRFGNVLHDTLSFSVRFALPANVVINEIFADPHPQEDMPAYEFIELYNTTGFDLPVKNWKIKAGDKLYSLNSDTLWAREHLIITHANGADGFQAFGKTDVAFTSTTALLNAGATLLLLNDLEETIDSVSYSVNWYGNS